MAVHGMDKVGELRVPRQADRRCVREVAVTLASPPSAALQLTGMRSEFSSSEAAQVTADGAPSGTELGAG
jgi:hypothetical protein